MSELVLFDCAAGVATLTLNRPQKRNALNLAVWEALNRHLDTVEAAGDTIGVVVLRANGSSFCAGNDLSERGAVLPAPHYQASTITRITHLPQPVVAAVQGGCYTGGLELVLAADIVVAAQSAVFADTHGKFALVPVWGLSQRLPRRIGQAKAREMSFTGLPVSGEEAARIGLANHCVADEVLDAMIERIAAAIAGQSRHSVFAYKALYRAQEDLPLAPGLAHEVFNSAGVGPDLAERVAAQFKK